MAGFEELLFEQMDANEKKIVSLRHDLARANRNLAAVRGLLRGTIADLYNTNEEKNLWDAIENQDMDAAARILTRALIPSTPRP